MPVYQRQSQQQPKLVTSSHSSLNGCKTERHLPGHGGDALAILADNYNRMVEDGYC
ncbi:MAG: hypothetical protein ACR2FI_01925 [Burkholderiales bacterium]